jgi:hypothetical protein
MMWKLNRRTTFFHLVGLVWRSGLVPNLQVVGIYYGHPFGYVHSSRLLLTMSMEEQREKGITFNMAYSGLVNMESF